MDDRLKVLVTGAGAPGGPGIIKALRKDADLCIHGADINPLASGSFFCEAFHIIPEGDDTEFVPRLVEVCQRNEISVVLPLVTRELPRLSKSAKCFDAAGIKVIVSDNESLNTANNKGRLYEHLMNFGIVVPDFRVINDAKGLVDGSHALGYPAQPVVMKPCIGNGSRGIRILDPNKNRFDLLFREKPTALFSTLEEIIQIIDSRRIPELVVCEYLPGKELTIDCIVDQGNVLEILIRTRDTISSGISTSGRFIPELSVETYIRQVVSALPGLKGPIGFQVKESVHGEYKMLECNPRIQGTSVAAMGCGVNLPLLAVYQCVGRAFPQYSKKDNIGFVRYYDEFFYEY